jgi:thiamine monophosphate kinase
MNNPRVIAGFPELAQIVDPQLKYDLLYVPDKVMASAVRTGCLRAAMDTSDGVQACLEILGRESGVGFELDEKSVNSIIDHRARRLADILELPHALFLFSAGHDWEIVFTCEEKDFALVEAAVANDLLGHGRVARLGTVVERSELDERGVLLRRVDGSTTVVQYYTDEKFVPRNYQDRPSQWLGFASRLGG